MKPVQILLVYRNETEVADIKYTLDKLELYYELSWASSAAEAIMVLQDKTIRRQIPDMVLIDEELQDKKGVDLLKDIRSRKDWQQFSCFLLISPDHPAASEPTDLPGLSGYINKPFSMNGAASSGSLNLVMDLMNRNPVKYRL